MDNVNMSETKYVVGKGCHFLPRFNRTVITKFTDLSLNVKFVSCLLMLFTNEGTCSTDCIIG